MRVDEERTQKCFGTLQNFFSGSVVDTAALGSLSFLCSLWWCRCGRSWWLPWGIHHTALLGVVAITSKVPGVATIVARTASGANALVSRRPLGLPRGSGRTSHHPHGLWRCRSGCTRRSRKPRARTLRVTTPQRWGNSLAIFHLKLLHLVLRYDSLVHHVV